MFDRFRLQEVLVKYKADFPMGHWKEERYKWEAVKHFQDNWDVNAPGFANMLTRSLAKTGNLLASMNNFPARMIQGFASTAPEEVRAMFIALFDESKDVVERIIAFKDQSSTLLEKYGNGAGQHYQYENAVSTYLWLRYPEKYYIYKYSEVKTVADQLGCDLVFKKGAYVDNLRNFFSLYNDICEYIKTDNELLSLFKACLDDACYPDGGYRTLTFDVGFYISRTVGQAMSQPASDEWDASGYTPGITVDEWVALLNDPEVFNENSLEIVQRFKDYGGQATCKQLSVRYGNSPHFYNLGSTQLAKRIIKKTGCPLPGGEQNDALWPILYYGKAASKDEEGAYIWRLREELSEALDLVDLSKVQLYDNTPDSTESRGYWWLNANPKIWSFSDIAVGEEQSYTLYNDNGNKRRIFQNFLDARAGDMVIGYESNPIKQITGLCQITAAQDGKEIHFKKIEGLAAPIGYAELRSTPELEKMEFFVNPNGSLFKLTKGEFDFIMDLIRDANPAPSEAEKKPYTKENFLEKVYMTGDKYDRLAAVLLKKKNIILQGAPGVGKTFAAKRLAYSIMGEKNEDCIEFVQFHQNYSYEDFVMGYKPVEDGFELKYGTFFRFCQKAANRPEQKFFFIIDEINRGNMSKIFGELLMLIEADYRGPEHKATLAYNGLGFYVPENLYIIGMMNTADRSLAMIDYALRRRFSFFDMEPGFTTEGFSKYQHDLNNETFDILVDRVLDLNREIAADKSLGPGFCIGHSYFCNITDCSDETMRDIVDYDILPMLSEYWFDDPAKVQRWENTLHGIFQ